MASADAAQRNLLGAESPAPGGRSRRITVLGQACPEPVIDAGNGAPLRPSINYGTPGDATAESSYALLDDNAQFSGDLLPDESDRYGPDKEDDGLPF